MSILSGSSILITGGTGSLGRALVRELLTYHSPDRVVVFSRDELKQYDMRTEWAGEDRLRFFLGDIRDSDRLLLALQGVDSVIHAAALKQVDTAEYNPTEYVKTNILGSENVIRASMLAGTQRVIALSTDKASSPANLYGATKLTADRLFVSSNHYAPAGGTRFSVVRYGNVMASRGSVIPLFLSLGAKGKPLPITDYRMTRFWITLPEAVAFVLACLQDMHGGEIFVPRIPSVRITDVAEAVAPEADTVEVGIRPGEKLHEEMISREDARTTLQQDRRFIIQPVLAGWGGRKPAVGKPLQEGFAYQSDTNDEWLSVSDIRSLIDTL